jgi:transcription-repair coupling factor (superfamily II helicase)
MPVNDIVNTEKIFSILKTRRKISVKGLIGSSQELFILSLAKYFPQVILVVDEDRIAYRYQQLKELLPGSLRIDEDHPYYLSANIIITTRYFLEQEILTKEAVVFSKDQTIDLDDIINRLGQLGYSREDTVEETNEYALRGGILDIYEPGSEPIRLELYGDRIFSVRRFSIQTQRSVESVATATLELAKPQSAKPFLQLINPEAVVVSEMDIDLEIRHVVISSTGEIAYNFVYPLEYFGDITRLKDDLRKKNFTYKFFIAHKNLGERLKTLLGDIEIYNYPLHHGFLDQHAKIMYITEKEIFGELRQKKPVYRGLFVDDLMGLKEGDYVVHSDYGIGQFKELVLIDFENRKVECLRIDYAGTDRVFLPIEKMNLLERYIATHEQPPKLSKLGSEVWLRAKSRAKKATERLALDLLQLYTRRSTEKGFSFAMDTFEMNELEASFPYEETTDQKKAIQHVKKDMEMPEPAERLICGDVGYGKTEIALRAAFKAALDGKQTMLLCPTTLLAFQHYTTFKKRLEPFPVTVEMVSRFRTKEELKKILKSIAEGKIDIAIGTHRLLQPDVQFKDLALLIIDEEQRFGVVQKEKIKNLRPGIDTFYLSATPIPRTLYMGLTGLKDISNIYTPPPGRKDIVTKILYYDEEEIKRIIENELSRGGQVIFIHNRIQTIETVRARLHRIIPELRICLLHGQMREDITARRMVDFLAAKYDLLLSTAIVESGLDIPTVNTIIVDYAHRFGLADLHQLRGRIGRSDIQGFAYFIIPSRRRITEEANKRLSALASYTSLGSGFRLALRDMEIRGVGNLLGKEQSGHINSIGYRLYMKILGKSIGELRGKKIMHEPILDLKMEAYFPSSYIEKTYERTALYKRLLDVESKFELDKIKEEIGDRFGKYPIEVENLFNLSRIRLRAREIGATEVVRRMKQVIYYKEGKITKKEDLRP